MSEEKDSAPPAPPKYSRYRSVRQAVKEPPHVVVPEQNNASFTRSMSRYRHPKGGPKHDHVASPPVPAIPLARRDESPVNANPNRRVNDPLHATQMQPAGNVGARRQTRDQMRETDTERLQRKARELREKEEEYRKAQREVEEEELRAKNQRAEMEAAQARQAEEKLAEQKRKDLERLEATLDAAVAEVPRNTSPPKEKFGFFHRKRANTKTTPRVSSGSGPHSLSLTRSRASNDSPPRASNEPQPTRLPPPSQAPLPPQALIPQIIEPGGGGVVPGTDAPISAVNAGERRVLIRCKQSSINLPITPETTPVELINSAANIMSQSIAPSSAILLESYTQLGLERRLRRYEHVRDIMNSWDRDTQNALIIQDSDSPKYDTDLEASSVPREAPGSVTVQLYHSQKPNRWNKAFVTLLSSGQIYMAKKAGQKMSDKNVVSLCHLSDFDIYTPIASQIRKLKPPKKHCYAVKSQQKTTMFLSTENFVHFFSTDDENIANRWYDAVQRWRSWYLVNRMGEGKKKASKKVTELTTGAPARPGTKAGPTHKIKVSVDENPYLIGSFQPLIDMDRFDGSGADEYDSEEENRPRQIPFHLRNSISLSPIGSRRESKRHPPPVSYKLPPEVENEFASSSLLGRSYSQRQKAQKDQGQLQSAGPFVEGPSLLNGTGHKRSLSTRTKRPETAGGPGTNGLHRGATQREKPKPLLDFTPQFKEAPQWDKTGKGHGVAPPPGGVPLVEVATTPENALADIPRAAVFRRDAAAARPATSGGPIRERYAL